LKKGDNQDKATMKGILKAQRYGAMQNTFVSAFILLVGVIIGLQRSPESTPVLGSTSPSTEVPTVAFCELIKHPSQYDQKLVRILAIEVFDTENTFLYDPLCSIVGTFVWAKSDCSDDQSCEKRLKLITKNIRRHKETHISRVGVIAVGRFKGPNEKGYGHLNGYKFSFDVTSIEKVTPVPSKIPWPWETKR
jgi:hypothetical protein